MAVHSNYTYQFQFNGGKPLDFNLNPVKSVEELDALKSYAWAGMTVPVIVDGKPVEYWYVGKSRLDKNGHWEKKQKEDSVISLQLEGQTLSLTKDGEVVEGSEILLDFDANDSYITGGTLTTKEDEDENEVGLFLVLTGENIEPVEVRLDSILDNYFISESEFSTFSGNVVTELEKKLESNDIEGLATTEEVAKAKEEAIASAKTFVEEQDFLTSDDIADFISSADTVNAINAAKQELDAKFAGLWHFKGTAESLEALAEVEKSNGDVYQVGDKEYAFDGENWVELGFNVDLSNYLTSSDIAEMATTGWVEEQGYLKADSIEGLASEESVNTLSGNVANAISDFVTEEKVREIVGDTDMSAYYTSAQTEDLFAQKEHEHTTSEIKLDKDFSVDGHLIAEEGSNVNDALEGLASEIVNNEEVVASALSELEKRIDNVNNVDLSGYYTSAQTDNLFAEKEHEHTTDEVKLSKDLIVDGHLIAEEGSDVNEAFESFASEIVNNEEVIASALSELEKKIENTENVDLSGYYTSAQTGDLFAKKEHEHTTDEVKLNKDLSIDGHLIAEEGSDVYQTLEGIVTEIVNNEEVVASALSELEKKIVASGEENTINGIKVNGEIVPINNKIADITIPEGITSDDVQSLIDQSLSAASLDNYYNKSEIDEKLSAVGEYNVIEHVKVNDVELDVTDKTVNIDLSEYAKSEVLTGYVESSVLEGYVKSETLSGYVESSVLDDYITSADTVGAINKLLEKVTGFFVFRGKKDSIEELNNIEEKTAGDIYIVGDREYAYDGEDWIELGYTTDLSGLVTSDEIADMATTGWVVEQGYLTEENHEGLATTDDVATAKEEAINAASANTTAAISEMATTGDVATAKEEAIASASAYTDEKLTAYATSADTVNAINEKFDEVVNSISDTLVEPLKDSFDGIIEITDNLDERLSAIENTPAQTTLSAGTATEISNDEISVRVANEEGRKNYLHVNEAQNALEVNQIETDDSILSQDITIAGGAIDAAGLWENDVIPSGTSVQDILLKLLCKEMFPNAATKPSISLKASGTVISGLKEIGSTVTVNAVNASTNDGKFNADYTNVTQPATEVEWSDLIYTTKTTGFTGYSNISGETAPAAQSVTVVKGVNKLTVNVSEKYSEPATTPLTNLNNEASDSAYTFVAGTATATTSISVTGVYPVYVNGVTASTTGATAAAMDDLEVAEADETSVATKKLALVNAGTEFAVSFTKHVTAPWRILLPSMFTIKSALAINGLTNKFEDDKTSLFVANGTETKVVSGNDVEYTIYEYAATEGANRVKFILK